MTRKFFLFFMLIVTVGCGTISRRALKHVHSGEKDLNGNKVPLRTWVISPDKIFPVIANVAKASFPKNKIHENCKKKRLHFWYFDSEQGDALLIMEVVGQDSTSTLNLYKPRYGATQPLITRDSIPITQFLIDLDHNVQVLGIPVVLKYKVTP